MNVQEDLKTYFEANPISNFKNLAKLKSWELVNDGFDSAAFYVEGVWKNYLFSLLWLEKDQQLKLTCEYDLNPPRVSRRHPAASFRALLRHWSLWMLFPLSCNGRVPARCRFQRRPIPPQ